MKTTEEYVLYVKDTQSVIADKTNLFVYETCVYTHYKGYFSLSNKKYFSSPKEIEGVVGSFFKTRHIQICSELFSAPEQWLIENGFTKYVKPEKIKKLKTKKVETDGK